MCISLTWSTKSFPTGQPSTTDKYSKLQGHGPSAIPLLTTRGPWTHTEKPSYSIQFIKDFKLYHCLYIIDQGTTILFTAPP